MGKDLWMPIHIALTGALHDPDLATIVELLGKQEARNRILQIVE
jgi:glutamyl/glutaminyl-tRNA synthetase